MVRQRVVWPSPTRVGGLLSASRPLPEGWERGVEFSGYACVPMAAVDPCEQDTKPAERSSQAAFDPVFAVVGVECSTLSNNLDDLEAAARSVFTAKLSSVLAGELAVSQVGNPDLADATTLGTASSFQAAVACLESAFLAETGLTGMIHAPIAYAAAAKSSLWQDGRRWRTVGGSVVVFDDYPATSITVTSDVHAGYADVTLIADVDRQVNTTTARVEALALVAYDPCVAYSVTVPEITCSEE